MGGDIVPKVLHDNSFEDFAYAPDAAVGGTTPAAQGGNVVRFSGVTEQSATPVRPSDPSVPTPEEAAAASLSVGANVAPQGVPPAPEQSVSVPVTAAPPEAVTPHAPAALAEAQGMMNPTATPAPTPETQTPPPTSNTPATPPAATEAPPPAAPPTSNAPDAEFPFTSPVEAMAAAHSTPAATNEAVDPADADKLVNSAIAANNAAKTTQTPPLAPPATPAVPDVTPVPVSTTESAPVSPLPPTAPVAEKTAIPTPPVTSAPAASPEATPSTLSNAVAPEAKQPSTNDNELVQNINERGRKMAEQLFVADINDLTKLAETPPAIEHYEVNGEPKVAFIFDVEHDNAFRISVKSMREAAGPKTNAFVLDTGGDKVRVALETNRSITKVHELVGADKGLAPALQTAVENAFASKQDTPNPLMQRALQNVAEDEAAQLAAASEVNNIRTDRKIA